MKCFITRIKNSKCLILLSILIIIVFLMFLTKTTFAYTYSESNNLEDKYVNGEDEFIISDNEVLKFDASKNLLSDTGKNYEVKTTEEVKLKSGTTNKLVGNDYYLYFEITNNNFNYHEKMNPEVILTITNPEGEVVTNVDGLIYGTFSGISGFDITNVTGIYSFGSYYIQTDLTKTYETQKWTATITYLNLGIDQSSNSESSLEFNLKLLKEEPSLIKVSLESSDINILGSKTKYSKENNIATFKTDALTTDAITCLNNEEASINEEGLVEIKVLKSNTTCQIKRQDEKIEE